MTKRIVAGVIALGMMTTGCAANIAFASRPVAHAVVYSGAHTNEAVTQNSLGTKKGESCAQSVLGIATWGDATAATAAKNGKIHLIGSVDNTYMSVLGVYAKYCVVVSGS